MNFYNYSQSQILIHSVAVISQKQFVYRSFFYLIAMYPNSAEIVLG